MAAADFKRILVELHHHAPDQSIRLAAEVASLLRLDLLGLFVEEESLFGLGALPFAREFRPFSGWRPIEVERLAQELDLAASSARRLFAEAVSGLGTACRFEVVRGSIAETIGSLSRGGDIVIIAEPASPADRATRHVAALVEAAFRSASAVMIVPKHIARRSGAVVAIASEKNDPSLAAATAIAASAREDLVVLQAFAEPDRASAAERPEKVGVSIKYVPIAASQLSHVSGIRSTFRSLHERLIVMARGAFDDQVASMIASTRHDPVLIIGEDIDEEVSPDPPPPT